MTNDRMKERLHILILACFATPLLTAAGGGLETPAVYTGLCDASAVETLSADLFAVADDEDNVLRVYHRDSEGQPVQSLDLSGFLRVDPKEPEADLEAAARIGERIYWITSHGRSRKGKERSSRQRFFATAVPTSNASAGLQPVGFPYSDLLEDMLRDPRLWQFHLDAAALRPPKDPGALNIEGLAATPEGHLLIGFRNPIPHGRALIVPLLNPAELIAGGRARFGDPLLLDLGDLGIRSITPWRGQYVIVAGSFDGEGSSRLYLWTGRNQTPRRLDEIEMGGLNPEAIAFLEEEAGERLLVVSDDGTREIDGKPCKKLKDASRKQFRVVTLPADVLESEAR